LFNTARSCAGVRGLLVANIAMLIIVTDHGSVHLAGQPAEAA
jgi:hypothetical protein